MYENGGRTVTRRISGGLKNAVFLIYAVFILTSACPVHADNTVGELRLIAGNRLAKDEDAFVFVILGEGFSGNEQELFFEKSEETAKYILETSPFKESQEIFKLYALGCISSESGARGDRAQSKQEEIEDSRDTFFHSRFWTDGVKRLLSVDETEEEKALLIAAQYVPEVDYAVILVNSDTYGGSGGRVCVASLHEKSVEIVLHELGHTIAGLGDEYWPGAAWIAETPNTTSQQNPELVPWADLVGEEDIGVYPFEDGEPGWYKPSQSCKMQYLGREYDFCAVCSRELTRAFALHSDFSAIRKASVRFRIVLGTGCGALLFLLVFIMYITKRRHKKC